MSECYITFRSITQAQRAARLLDAEGVGCRLLRTPKSISAGGCGYALRLDARWAEYAGELFSRNGVGFQKIFRRGDGSGFEDAWL